MSDLKHGSVSLIKVIKIIDEYNVLINVGSNAGAKINDIYEIYSPGEEIIDPDTNESLGTLDFVKARIATKTIYEKMSLCTNTEVNQSVLVAAMLSSEKMYRSSTKPLDVDALDISGGFENTSKKIKIGDLVRKAR